MNLNNAQILLELQISKVNLSARIYCKKDEIASLCRAISALSGIYREYSTYHIEFKTGSDNSGQPKWTVTCSTPKETYTTPEKTYTDINLYEFLHQALGMEKNKVERLEAELNKIQESVIRLEREQKLSETLEQEQELKNEQEQKIKELIMEALKDWLEQIQELIQKRKQELENERIQKQKLENERKNQQSGQSRGRGGR